MDRCYSYNYQSCCPESSYVGFIRWGQRTTIATLRKQRNLAFESHVQISTILVPVWSQDLPLLSAVFPSIMPKLSSKRWRKVPMVNTLTSTSSMLCSRPFNVKDLLIFGSDIWLSTSELHLMLPSLFLLKISLPNTLKDGEKELIE